MTHVTEKAMLAKLTISQWSANRFDGKITQDVAAQHGADVTMGRYTKRLLAKEALSEIGSAVAAARACYYKHTLPWRDDGARILPAANYFGYMQEAHAIQHTFEAAVQKFEIDYPNYVNAAKTALNGLFDARDYPDPSKISNRFSMRVDDVFAMPDAADFRISLGEEEEARVRARIEANVNEAVNTAMTDLWQRVHDQVQRMAERLRAYDETDKDGKRVTMFRDSLVGNMRELVSLLGRLNFTGSNSLEAMRGRLEDELCSFDASTLRDDDKLRADVASKAEKILDDVKDFLA
jgi:hypothetical protein